MSKKFIGRGGHGSKIKSAGINWHGINQKNQRDMISFSSISTIFYYKKKYIQLNFGMEQNGKIWNKSQTDDTIGSDRFVRTDQSSAINKLY